MATPKIPQIAEDKVRCPTATQARAARADVETALDTNGWRWSLALSRWVDMLVVLEERSP